MSQPAWYKILFVGVHCSLIHLNFVFRPFKFSQAPFTVMSVNPHTCIIDRILGVTQRVSKRCNKSRGKQLKPCILAVLEECHVEGTYHSP